MSKAEKVLEEIFLRRKNRVIDFLKEQGYTMLQKEPDCRYMSSSTRMSDPFLFDMSLVAKRGSAENWLYEKVIKEKTNTSDEVYFTINELSDYGIQDILDNREGEKYSYPYCVGERGFHYTTYETKEIPIIINGIVDYAEELVTHSCYRVNCSDGEWESGICLYRREEAYALIKSLYCQLQFFINPIEIFRDPVTKQEYSIKLDGSRELTKNNKYFIYKND